MADKDIQIPACLIESIKDTPVCRSVTHCGLDFETSVFDIYAECPQCGTRLKLRAYSAIEEIEDVFDAVFQWSLKPDAAAAMQKRIAEIASDTENRPGD